MYPDEVQFISYIIESRDMSVVIENNIDESWFAIPEKNETSCRSEFKYILNYYNTKGEVPTKTTFLTVFPEFDFVAVPDSPEVALSDFKDSVLLDSIAKTINSSVSSAYFNSSRSKAERVEDIMNIIEKLQNKLVQRADMKYSTLDDLQTLLKQTFWDRQQSPDSIFYKTGFDFLDNYFLGWDKDNDYVVVAGRPGTGKSMLLCALAAEQLSLGRRVAFYEGEMSKAQTMERVVAHLYDISETSILKGEVGIEDRYMTAIERLAENGGEFALITPHDLGDKYPTVSQLELFCKKINADILFIDQQSLMEDRDHAKQFFERASNISRQIKGLRDKLNIPVITAVQQNRTQSEEGSNTAQIAGSDVIAQDATKVLFLRKDKENEDNIIIDITKNRTGKSFVSHTYKREFEYCRFAEIEEYGEDVF